MLRALPTWFQEPRVPDACWNPNLLPATRREPRREPHREPPLPRATVTDRSTSLATPSRRSRHVAAARRTSTLTLPP